MTHLNKSISLVEASLNRSAEMRTNPDALNTLRTDQTTRYIVLWRGKPLVDANNGSDIIYLAPNHPLIAATGQDLFLGTSEGSAYFAKDISSWGPDDLDVDAMQQFLDQTTQHHPLAQDGHDFCELRTVMAQLSPFKAELIATARSMFEWHRIHGFCANCGHATDQTHAGWQRDCPACKRPHFPRTDPVVIMLITSGEKVLLGRSPQWPEGMYSLLAGFLEPGETIEAAVRREVFEESGIKVGDVRYLSSQPWPYPSSLMIGCHGIATSDTITIDPIEIEDALWVSKSGVLDIYSGMHPVINPPRKGAIAEFLLRQWLADCE